MKQHDLSAIVMGNAAGVVKTYHEALPLLKSAATRITVGSITIEKRRGNLGETYHFNRHQMTAWNAWGIPNPGLTDTVPWIEEFRKLCHREEKELAVSIAGFSPEQYGLLASAFARHVDVLEINAGCGNLWDGGTQKLVPSYYPELLETIIETVGRSIGYQTPRIAVKISPLAGTDENQKKLGAIAHVIAKSGVVDEVIATNTEINQAGTREDGTSALAFRENEDGEVKRTGGMSGAWLRPKSLEVVRYLAETLPDHIEVVGCGGIFIGNHVIEYLDAGARGVEVATAFFEFGKEKIFSDLFQQADAVLSARAPTESLIAPA